MEISHGLPIGVIPEWPAGIFVVAAAALLFWIAIRYSK